MIRVSNIKMEALYPFYLSIYVSISIFGHTCSLKRYCAHEAHFVKVSHKYHFHHFFLFQSLVKFCKDPWESSHQIRFSLQLQTEQCFSSEPSPHPSRPLQAIASERHLPLSHLKGHVLGATLPRYRVRQAPLGSSLPSRQDTTALQNSYAGKHCPLLHLKAPSGHLRRLLHSFSSSLSGQSLLPSQRPALETQTPLLAHLNAWTGQLPFEHSSSEPSTQSARPSQTKNQLMQFPELLHWKVPGVQPPFFALQLELEGKLQSQIPSIHLE